LARQAGFEIYVDTTFFLRHWEGGRGYPEEVPEQMRATQTNGRGNNQTPPAKVYDMMGNEIPASRAS